MTVNALSPAGNPVTDVSDWGSNPDPNGNGSAGDSGEDTVTVITLSDETSIGVAKNVTLNGTQATFDFYLENFGNSVISSLSLPDDLDAVLGSGRYTLLSGPTLIDDPGTITLNTSFDGGSSTNLLQTSSSLNALDTAQIQVVVQVNVLSDQGLGVGSYSNQGYLNRHGPIGFTGLG